MARRHCMSGGMMNGNKLLPSSPPSRGGWDLHPRAGMSGEVSKGCSRGRLQSRKRASERTSQGGFSGGKSSNGRMPMK